MLSVVKIVNITSVWYGHSPGIPSYAECCPIPGTAIRRLMHADGPDSRKAAKYRAIPGPDCRHTTVI
jgi:hypothetical protein